MYKLDLQHKYRVSSIEHNSGIVGYRRNFVIDPALYRGSQTFHHYVPRQPAASVPPHIHSHARYCTRCSTGVELGQMVSISKYRGTTQYQYRIFNVSKYRLTTGWFIFNVIRRYMGLFNHLFFDIFFYVVLA